MDYRCNCGTFFNDRAYVQCPKCYPLKPLDPKGEAGAKKTPLHLLPPVFKAEVADALKLGSEKYGPWNWREAQVEVRTYVGAIMRHVDAFWGGEDTDPESGVSHLAHAAASIAIILDAAKCGTLVDNRPNKP